MLDDSNSFVYSAGGNFYNVIPNLKCPERTSSGI
jgi:hypothetical protein